MSISHRAREKVISSSMVLAHVNYVLPNKTSSHHLIRNVFVVELYFT